MEDPIASGVDRGPQILIICGTLVGISLVMVLLRIWVRAVVIKQLGWDDYTIMVAMAVMFAEMMVIIPQVRLGAGRHVEDIEPKSNVVKGLHLNFITQPLCLIALCLTKASVGLFLLRITPSKRYRSFIWGAIVFTILSSLGNLLTVFLQCRPLAFAWDTSIEGGRCIPPWNLKFAAYFNSSVSVLTDVTFSLLPIPMILQVQLNRKLKIAVACILSLGIFAAVAAVVKITFLKDYGKYGDFLFDSSDLTIWTTVEICTAIVAACAPCLRAIFKTVLSGSSAHYRFDSGRNLSNSRRRIADVPLHGFQSAERGQSEERIISPKDDLTITRTTQITVSVEDSKPR